MLLEQQFIFFSIAQILILKDKPFFDKIATTDTNILTENEDSIVNTLLFGKLISENSFNKAMLGTSIEFTTSNERFNNPVF